MEPLRVTALIMAAGAGERMGLPTPKQYLPLAGGDNALRRALRTFSGHDRVSSVYGVIHPSMVDAYAGAADGLNLAAPISGGATRQASVRNGLEALAALPTPPDYVLIHDAARAITPAHVIDAVLDALEHAPAAAPALAVADSLATTNKGLIAEPVPREGLMQIQTPQGFRFGAILSAHRRHEGTAVTDDISLIRLDGGEAAIVAGSPLLHKLTTGDDKHMVERLLAANETPSHFPTPRVGSGYDVHAFGPGDHVTLCGVDIPHGQGLIGHSDADVAMHALTDAILGAAAAGDIGSHFPPSDPQWKGAASHIFLEEAARIVSERNGRIAHVDVTIVCEAPKIGPHRAAMQACLADILSLPLECVSVKATTSERLGFTGRKEGIAAMATATVLF